MPFWRLDSIQLWMWMTRITHLMMDDLMSFDFPTYHTFDAILGHIPFRFRFIDLYGVAWSPPLTRCMHRRWLVVILSWSLSGTSLEPSSQACTFRYLDVIIIFLLGYVSLIDGPDSVMDVDDQDYIFDDGWFEVIWFFLTYHTSGSILGHISSSVEICGSPLIGMVHLQLGNTRRVDDLLSFCLNSLVESFLSHSIKLVLSDIVVILGWSYLRCIASHIIISVEYMLDLLYIPIELFLSYQDRLDALVAILGHISLF